jgi:membrane dipeptidase
MIVDGHQDIAWNALGEGRGFDGPPAPGYVVSRPALQRAGVGLVFPTIFSLPPAGSQTAADRALTYRTPHEAHVLARAQLNYYHAVGLRLLTSGPEVREYARTWVPGALAGVLLMESADPIESPAQVKLWKDLGVRLVGPAWMRTRYCGGTKQPGGLTEAGRGLLRAMMRHGLLLDLSHMADRAMRESFEAWRGPLVSTHSGARAVRTGQRQLPDWALQEIGRRDGIAGISFFRGHIAASGTVSPDDVVDHARYFARLTGDVRHVALGSDLDGGFGAKDAAIQSMSGMVDLRRRLVRAFNRVDADAIMGANWLRFLEASLPAG